MTSAINQLNLPLAMAGLFIRHQPNIGENSRVVEQLIRQRHRRIQPVIFNNPTSNIALTAASIPSK